MRPIGTGMEYYEPRALQPNEKKDSKGYSKLGNYDSKLRQQERQVDMDSEPNHSELHPDNKEKVRQSLEAEKLAQEERERAAKEAAKEARDSPPRPDHALTDPAKEAASKSRSD